MSIIDKTLTSFIDVAADSDFSIHNLPYGIFSETPEGRRRVGVAIGDKVLDLAALEEAGLLKLTGASYFDQPTLNSFIESGRQNWSTARRTIQDLLSADNATLRDNEALKQKALFNQSAVSLHLPYTSLAIPIFIHQKSMRPTLALCSAILTMPYYLTGRNFRWVITDVPAR